MRTGDLLSASCPLPITNHKEIVLAHGSGGKLSHQLIEKMMLPQFRNELLEPLHDGAIFSLNGERSRSAPIHLWSVRSFFPEAISETRCPRNGQRSRDVRRAPALSLGHLSWKKVCRWKISGALSSRCALQPSRRCEVVTGDTKVVDRGKADKIFINTSGIGVVPDGVNIHPARAAVGDKIIISGPIAVHGIAIMSVREGLEFETEIASDTAPLHSLVACVNRRPESTSTYCVIPLVAA